MKMWYKIDPIQGANDAITWNVGRYGIEMDSYGNNQGIKAMMQTNGMAEKKNTLFYIPCVYIISSPYILSMGLRVYVVMLY